MNGAQLAITVGLAVIGLAMIVLGLVLARRVWVARKPGDPIEGPGIGLALAGTALTLFAVHISIELTSGWGTSGLDRWWFVPPTPGNGIVAALANPPFGLFMLGVLVFFLGLPSWTQLRALAALLRSPRTRVQTVWAVLGAVAWLGLSIGASLAVYDATGSRLLASLTFFGTGGGILAITTLILVRRSGGRSER